MSDVYAPEPPAAEPAATPPEGGEERQTMGRQAKVVVAVLAVIVAVALFWPRGDGSFEAPGGFLTDAQGRAQTLGPRMTPVTLVHFWATWCPPCITEIPTLDDLAGDLAGVPQFTLLMIAVADEAQKVQTFLGGASDGVLFDPQWEVAHRYGTRLLPETYLVVEGEVVEKWEGAQDWSDPKLRRRIEEALREVGARSASLSPPAPADPVAIPPRS